MKTKQQGAWRDMLPPMVDPSNPCDLERLLQRYIRQEMRPLSTKLNMLPAGDCFDSIMADGTRMVLFLPDDGLILDDETLDEASKFHAEAVTQPVALDKRRSPGKIYLVVTTPGRCDTGISWRERGIRIRLDWGVNLISPEHMHVYTEEIFFIDRK